MQRPTSSSSSSAKGLGYPKSSRFPGTTAGVAPATGATAYLSHAFPAHAQASQQAYDPYGFSATNADEHAAPLPSAWMPVVSQPALNATGAGADVAPIGPQRPRGSTGQRPHPYGASTSKAISTLGKSAGGQPAVIRAAAGEIWHDPTLSEWDPNDYRLFCGDLGPEVNDELLTNTFGRYPSFQKARVVYDKKKHRSKGYGFVSFKDPEDYARAFREFNGKYVGSRPIKLRKSNWDDRTVSKTKAKKLLGNGTYKTTTTTK